MTTNILIVEDDLTIRTLLEMAIVGAGYRADVCADGAQALAALQRERFDLALLDIMLPFCSGLEIARKIRSDPALATMGVIMLTALSTGDDIIRGLDAGADDYVTKPFDRKVLLARIRSVLRRGNAAAGAEVIEFDRLRLDKNSRQVTLNDKILEFTGGEFDLLTRLLESRGRIFRRDATERTLDVQIANIRRKTGDWSAHIETIRGIGYRLQ